MVIIETCPKCGHDLHDVIIATFQPIPRKECPSCGWYWEGEPKQVVRVPFGGNTFKDTTLSLNDYLYPTKNFENQPCLNCPSNPKNGGDGICFCILGQMNVVY